MTVKRKKKPAAEVDDEPINWIDIRARIEENRTIVERVRLAIGPTTMTDTYGMVEMNWASFKNAINRGSSLTPLGRGKPRKGRYSGVEALAVLTEKMRPKSRRDYARILRSVAKSLESEK